MAKSDYVFLSGEAVDVGTHGEHDYLFQSGVPITDRGTSTYVFESGTGLGGVGRIIDDYEDQNTNEYQTGDPSDWGFTPSAVEGSFALFTDMNVGATNLLGSNDGLENYPSYGVEFRSRIWFDFGAPSGDNGYRDWEFHVGWGGDSPSNGARVALYSNESPSGSGDPARIALEGPGGTLLDESPENFGDEEEEWLDVQVTHDTDGSISAFVFAGVEDITKGGLSGSYGGEGSGFDPGDGIYHYADLRDGGPTQFRYDDYHNET